MTTYNLEHGKMLIQSATIVIQETNGDSVIITRHSMPMYNAQLKKLYPHGVEYYSFDMNPDEFDAFMEDFNRICDV